jgi:hypothetical protein
MSFRNSLHSVLFFACMVAVPGTAQQPSMTVPANVSPHPAPAQPLPFSHRNHLVAGAACQSCHTNPEPGIRMAYPSTETCMSCHRTVATDNPDIMTVRDFSVVEMQIPWVRVYAITPGVTWSHRAHLDAGTQCEACHGNVSQLDAMAETTAIRSMASCIACHQASGASAACVTCHAWPSDRDLGFE